MRLKSLTTSSPRRITVIKKYKVRPLVVEAMQYLGPENKDKVIEFLGYDPLYLRKGVELWMNTVDGPTRAKVSDWVVKESDGSYLPYNEEMFNTLYEELDND